MATTYRPPGVYFTETINPQFVSLTGSERILTIVGAADNSTLIINQAVTKGALNTEDTWIASGEITEIIGVGDIPGIYNYVLPTDYTLASNRRGIDWTPHPASEPTAGAIYYATYKVLKVSTNYVCTTKYSIEDVRTEYGSELWGGTINEVTLGAYAAFKNGSSIVKLCQINPSTNTTYLTSAITSSAATIAVADTTGFDSSGSLKLESEVIAYTGTTPTSFTGCTRAQSGTTAASHGIYFSVFSVATTSAVATAYTAALEKCEEEETDIIMVMSTDATIQGYLKTHIQEMSSSIERKERIGIITNNDISDTATVIKARAEAIDYQRMVLVTPSPIVITVMDSKTAASSEETVTGIYSACGLAGRICNPNYAVSDSMTRKQIIGFDELGRTFKESEMNDMASGGVCIFIADGTDIIVRHAITTDPTNANTAEISVVMIKDYVVKSLRSLLDTTYVGTRITPGTLESIKLSTQTLLKSLIKYTIINDYDDINAIQDLADPRIVDVTFSFEAVYPLVWIDVTYQLFAA